MTKFFNTPWRITIVAEIMSLFITGIITYVISREFVSVSLIIAFIYSGPIAYVISSVMLRYQREVEEQNKQLEALTEGLQQTNQQLQMSNSELNAYAHTVAHDLKAPVSTLLSASSVLQNKNFSPEQHEFAAQIILRTAKKMNNIIHELLLLSTLRESDVIQIAPLDMVKILCEVEDRLGALPERSDAEIIYPESWPTAEGYAPWVEAVWTNYLSNAIKYGGRPPKIVLGATQLDSATAKFWVKDNGNGITSEQQARLFTPFERLTQTTIEGHGLGLSIVQRIVNRLDGKVGVESDDSGSTFFFTLPLANQQQ